MSCGQGCPAVGAASTGLESVGSDSGGRTVPVLVRHQAEHAAFKLVDHVLPPELGRVRLSNDAWTRPKDIARRRYQGARRLAVGSAAGTHVAVGGGAVTADKRRCRRRSTGPHDAIGVRSVPAVPARSRSFPPAIRGPRSLAVMLVATLALAWGCRSSTSSGPDSGRIYEVPSAIADDCSEPVEEELNAFLASVPNDAEIRFRARGCYAQANRIQVYDKANVTIDGRGSTFRSSAPNDGKKLNPNWLLLRGRNLTLKNLTAVGNFNLTGARSQARVNMEEIHDPPVGNQFNAGVFVYGGDGIHVIDVKARNVFGDGIGTAVSQYVMGSGLPHESPRNVHIVRFEATTTARHCFAPTTVTGLWLEDSIGRDCWYGGMDLELDNKETQQLNDIHVVGNTFDGFFQFGLAIPVAGAGDNTRDIEIRENTFATTADNVCNPVILVGNYPSNPNTFKGIAVVGNQLEFVAGAAVRYDHVQGGSVLGNTFTQVPPPGHAEVRPAYCGGDHNTQPVSTTNSTEVRIENNRYERDDE